RCYPPGPPVSHLHAPARPPPPTLSLHDALPICSTMTPLRHPIAECPVPISSHLFRDRLEYARSVRPRTYFFWHYLWASLFIFIYLVHFSLISHASALSSWAGPACRTSAARPAGSRPPGG